jgi:hypothetical protein
VTFAASRPVGAPLVGPEHDLFLCALAVAVEDFLCCGWLIRVLPQRLDPSIDAEKDGVMI